MKKLSDVNAAKERVQRLLGKKVVLKLNRGRNKVKSYNGVLSEAHANVFVVKLNNDILDRISCSYTDMLCGEVSVLSGKSQTEFCAQGQ